jgi:xanthine dehydrogenase accessory factor
MSATRARLERFLASSPHIALVEVIQALGSTPRDVATWMLVSKDGIFGTIGGGRLEFMAIDRAREMIEAGIDTDKLDVPLGPEIGQCCGGRVKVYLALLDEELRTAIPERIVAEEKQQPNVYLFGAGHVGHALASTLALLPLNVSIVETRADALEELAEGVRPVISAMPETLVRDAPQGSAFVVLTHDHALDFLIVAEALKRGDAAYVGMIGSKTKRATFNSWFVREADGDPTALEQLVSPIGGSDVKDKRPEIIAALATAEVIRAFASANLLV